ncbi:uncharacterized protein B0H64DRAFT_246674 [Chaetomium fimeti]|uniref:Uncharacterized protein n=1 Tax=Chaetomium fimeti TaxID=1854472 RepID=A0AAE0LNJ7_9PEZI|nr:hypothetical protein B0H64DRAFT_246674 [Chaetomium fimeti]
MTSTPVGEYPCLSERLSPTGSPCPGPRRRQILVSGLTEHDCRCLLWIHGGAPFQPVRSFNYFCLSCHVRNRLKKNTQALDPSKEPVCPAICLLRHSLHHQIPSVEREPRALGWRSGGLQWPQWLHGNSGLCVAGPVGSCMLALNPAASQSLRPRPPSLCPIMPNRPRRSHQRQLNPSRQERRGKTVRNAQNRHAEGDLAST